MRLYDETTGEPADVEIRPRMTMYVCGITPYDSAHLGHAFTYVHFDVLARYLRHLGADVVHVQNVTDVDDDILRTARERRVDYRELVDVETRKFDAAMRAIGVAPPTLMPFASEFIDDIQREVASLLSQGCAYERAGTVYFRVAAFPRYGRSLCGLDRDDMLALAAERGGHPEDPNKDDPLDFVLWQRSAPGEPAWPSPWGDGRPGWHIECSTMIRRLLGQPIDVHGGGRDLIYPHHESEIAQAEAVATDDQRPFVRHWVHTGEVRQDGDKMSKSLGNMTFVTDLLERYDGRSIRRFLLARHYRREWEFREEELAASVDSAPPPGPADRESFFRAMDDDLDTPSALGVLDRARAEGSAASRALVEEGERILGLEP